MLSEQLKAATSKRNILKIKKKILQWEINCFKAVRKAVNGPSLCKENAGKSKFLCKALLN